MASNNTVQQVQEFNSLIDRGSIPEEIEDVVVPSTYDYVQALRQVGVPPPEIQQYVANNVEIAKSIGLKGGALRKFLETEGEKSIQAVVEQRDAQQIQQMQQEQQHQQAIAMQQQMQQQMQQGIA